MAKTQLKNYVFKPGIGAADNYYSDAYSLLSSNKTFIQKEIISWIQKQITNGGQFTPTGAIYNPTTGVMTLTIGSHNLQVGDVIRIAANSLTFTCALDNNATTHTYPRSTGVPNDFETDPVYNSPIFIENRTDTTITVNVGISSDTSVHTFVSATTNAIVGGFPGYTYNSLKCERDVGFVLDAYLYDLRYNGNEKTINTIKYYWDKDVAQVDGDRFPEIATHKFIGNLITDYIFINTLFDANNTEILQTIDNDKNVANLEFTPTAALYIPTTGNITLTIGTHSLDIGDEIFIAPYSLTFTCALDNNVTTHKYPRAFDVPNIKGKDPYYYAPLKITSKTANTITVNVGISSDISVHTFVSADANSITSGAFAKINTLVFNTVDVITNGLSSIPTLVRAGVGTIKIQGNYSLSQLLLITNVTKNEIIYNFSNAGAGGLVTFKTDSIIRDNDFPSYLQTTDAVTIITLNYDTRNHSDSDELQIFVENIDNGDSIVKTRPFDFGTDAIERMRIATPQSMLDADFEYGLQPTKWAGIATLRGYPSVYEIPGTDLSVLSITTDASTGTSGIGQSLITVTTVVPHRFTAGIPITIKGLNDTIIGSARAEGSFIINTVPSDSVFTYFAKSKVGTVNGQRLDATYTQLRKAGFYTGADIGDPSFSIVSNGSAGTIVTELGVATGSNIIPYDGPAPSIGAPLIDPTGAIPVGSQVTGVVDTSAGGGTYITPTVLGSYPAGVNSITVQNSTGIVNNLAVNRGDNTAIYVTNVVGNTITFSDSFTAPVVGNIQTYNNISGTNDVSTGIGATFNISKSAGVYFASINNGGTNYKVGDILKVLGSSLGGASPANDATIRVTTVSSGAVTGVVISGTAFNIVQTVASLSPTINGGTGVDAVFELQILNNVYQTVTATTPGSGYIVNDIVVISGSSININGLSPTNNARIKITGVDEFGSIISATVTGTAPDAYAEYASVLYITSGTGINADFNVTRSGTAYGVTFNDVGTGFNINDTITVLGTDLGGTSPANDLIITVNSIGALGEVDEFSTSGVAINSETVSLLSGSNLVGSGFNVDVSLDNGVYSISINNGGSNYGADQTFTISGTDLLGTSPANDLTITITEVNSAGVILTATPTGTAAGSPATYTGVSSSNVQSTGINATFNITRTNGVYAVTSNTSGSEYVVGNRIVILGTQLNGTSPANDILITITSVSSGAVDGFSFTGTANSGVSFDLISTITISSFTITSLAKNVSIAYSALATIEIQFTNNHGLVPGNTFIVTIESDNGTNNHSLAAGSFFASDVPTKSTLRYQARAPGTITQDVVIRGTIYPRPDSFFVHRPYDGGVQLGTGGPQHGAQAIRQSKKYIRYQSGKGIMYTTGALFAPSYDIRNITADGIEVGSTITVVTDDNDHGLQIGGIVRLLGVETPGYNSGSETATPPEFDYEVTNIIDERTFQIRAQRRLGSTTPSLGLGAQVSVVSWHGASVRSGIFDDQNGIFWEYNGSTLSVVQRSSTRQITGTISVNVNSNLITGSNTKFRDQLKSGDKIVVKGMTHVVTSVNSQTEITVTPDWRGVTDISGVKANLVTDKRVKQSEFNLDKLDGTGPSGYKIDMAKMQMIGIQYSWYGAGFIDFMLRSQTGNFVFAHRMRNSNVNTEAFMRSGNLPVRYEVINESASARMVEDITNSQTTIVLDDSSYFPNNGTVYVDNEIINYTGNNKVTNTLTGCIRAGTLTNYQSGANRQYSAGPATSHDSKTGVILVSNTITPIISHWGSAFLTDGGFDEDRGYIFSYAETNLEINTIKKTAFMIRLAPSVSNAIVGDLGERELLNRAQLLLQGLEITSDGITTGATPATITGGIVVEGILNPQNYPTNPSNVTWNELSGLAQGGQPSFAQIAGSGGINWDTGVKVTNNSSVVQGAVTASFAAFFAGNSSGGANRFAFQNGNTDWYIPNSVYDTSNIEVGDVYTGDSYAPGSFPANSTISRIDRSIVNIGGILFTRIRMSGNFTGTSLSGTSGNNSGQTVTLRKSKTSATYTAVNYLNYTKASFTTALAAGVSNGTLVDSTDTAWPAGTRISSVVLRQFGTTEYYEVTFNSTLTSTVNAGASTTFDLTPSPFAEPGETVFSFIANPGERSTVDFSQLKELTNTPLGGRGTYPNGPDVLAINVYKVSGVATQANLILKWGEAQA
jgi:hypothetical protein